MGVLNWILTNIVFAPWNLFSKVISTAPVKANPDESKWGVTEWLTVAALVLLPLGLVLYVLHYFKIVNLKVFRKKARHRRSVGLRRKMVSKRRRPSPSARSKQLAALARGRATRRRNARAKKK